MKKTNHMGFTFPPVLAWVLAAAMALWLFTPAHTVQAAGDPIVVIVNVANPVDNLSVGELRRLFLSDRSKWNTGIWAEPVIVAAGTPERKAFLKIVCGMTDADFGKYFLQAAFTGKSAAPPKEVSNARDVKGVVAGSPGAIGFVKAADFHGDGSDGGVKAVKIDDADASDPSYKLRM